MNLLLVPFDTAVCMYVPTDDKIVGGNIRFDTKAVGLNMERSVFTPSYFGSIIVNP